MQSLINNDGVMPDLPPAVRQFVSATEIRRRAAQFQIEFPEAVTDVDSDGDMVLRVRTTHATNYSTTNINAHELWPFIARWVFKFAKTGIQSRETIET